MCESMQQFPKVATITRTLVLQVVPVSELSLLSVTTSQNLDKGLDPQAKQEVRDVDCF